MRKDTEARREAVAKQLGMAEDQLIVTEKENGECCFQVVPNTPHAVTGVAPYFAMTDAELKANAQHGAFKSGLLRGKQTVDGMDYTIFGPRTE